MTETEIEEVLDRCESALEQTGTIDLKAEKFWTAVRHVKRDQDLVEQFADRIGAIDQRAFEQWVLRSYPIALGETLLWLGSAGALAVIALGYYVDAPVNGVLLLAGTALLLATTHGLGHLVVGRVVGIRFTRWFIADLRKPQPGVKTDYASYLRVAARRRAWMHASGALVTKAMPFLLLGAAWGMEAPGWAWVALVAIGLVMIITDMTMSVKQSDWKKFNREIAIARETDLTADGGR